LILLTYKSKFLHLENKLGIIVPENKVGDLKENNKMTNIIKTMHLISKRKFLSTSIFALNSQIHATFN
jgi:hypothetical protein